MVREDIEELMHSDNCFCGKPTKLMTVKKLGENHGKTFYTCKQGVWDPNSGKTFGACGYFRMQGDPYKECDKCNRPLSIYKGDVTNAYCKNEKCATRTKAVKETKLKKDALESIIRRQGINYGCPCGEPTLGVNKWPFVTFYCPRPKDKQCGFNCGAEVLFNHPQEKTKPTDLRELYMNPSSIDD